MRLIGWGHVTLTVINQTNRPIEAAQLLEDNKLQLLSLGPIPAGETRTDNMHFGDNEEGYRDLVLQQSGRTTTNELWLLIGEHGPYEYTVTVKSTGTHVEYFVGSKGSGAWDFASPTTMP